MEITDKIDMFLLSESGKVVITPYGKSAIGRQEKWSKEEFMKIADDISAAISSDDTYKYELTFNKSSKKEEVVFYRKDKSSIKRLMSAEDQKEYVDYVSGFLKKAGYKVVETIKNADWMAFVIDKK